MVQTEIKNALSLAVKRAYPKIKIDDIKVERTKDPAFGDYSTNISLRIASVLRLDPLVVSEKIISNIKNNKFSQEAVSGYINFSLKEDYYYNQLTQILKEGSSYASSSILKGKKVQVEFISANPTGPLHLGNGRGGFSGDVIANVLSKLGAKVEREYYVNDAGNQIAALGESALVAVELKKDRGELYRGAWLKELASQKKEILTKNINNPQKIGEIMAKMILEKEIKPVIKDMNIAFDNWFSEKSLDDTGILKKAIESFTKKKLIYDGEGATWFSATEFGDSSDHVLVRSDGTPAYYLGDIAYHYDKLVNRKFDRVINIWGADHHGHVMRLQAAVKAMGQAGKLDVIITQLVRLIKDGKEFRMSKRKGNSVTMSELFELIGGTKKEASDVARFFFLSRASDTHMDFNLDLAREHTEKNPVFYVKYAYARMAGILNKAEGLKKGKTDLTLLDDEREIELIKELTKLPELLVAIASDKTYPVHHLTFYARSLAQKFHSFYDACKVVDEKNPEKTRARVDLVRANMIVLGIVMRDLINIETPEKM